MHPTSLHREEKYRSEYENKSKNQEVNMTTKNNFKIACPTIPIVMRNKRNGKTIKTYAALD